jgi:hypothetical protein
MPVSKKSAARELSHNFKPSINSSSLLKIVISTSSSGWLAGGICSEQDQACKEYMKCSSSA